MFHATSDAPGMTRAGTGPVSDANAAVNPGCR
jgi:hypothetical protein